MLQSAECHRQKTPVTRKSRRYDEISRYSDVESSHRPCAKPVLQTNRVADSFCIRQLAVPALPETAVTGLTWASAGDSAQATIFHGYLYYLVGY
ncbi:hypothetical protein J6590_005920 [Homalodisca vitripennis]|nr:hypothetical protein J6590_005920 [Homalodisca vitripennis]